jgi:putative PIN family toxin of toxin-antitoxin system
MIRAVLDANVFISYLLAPDRSGVIQRCVESGLSGTFGTVVPEPLLEEISRKVGEKPYLVERIAPTILRSFVAVLLNESEIVPVFDDSIPDVSRDDKDDYLIAYAKVADADYLVTGDKDILALRDLIERPMIRTPAEFAHELRF